MALITFATNSYRSRSLPLSAQRVVNLFAEAEPQDTKTPVALFGAPGLTRFCPAPTGSAIRAMRVMHDVLYFVEAGELYTVDAAAVTVHLGNVGSVTGPIMMSDNGAQLFILNNQEAYILSISISASQGPPGSEQGAILVGSTTTLLDDAAQGATVFVVAYTQTVLRWTAGDLITILLSNGALFNTSLALDVSTATIYLDTPLQKAVEKFANITDIAQDIVEVTTSPGNPGDMHLFVQSTEGMTIGDGIDITYADGSVGPAIITALDRGPTVTIVDPIPWQAVAGSSIANTTTKIYKVEDINYYPADTVTYFDNYFVLNRSGTNEFFISAQGDGTSYPPLSFATAQVMADNVIAVTAYHEALLVIGSRSIETWYNAGGTGFPFNRYDGATIERGVAAAGTVTREDNALFFLGNDKVFYQLEGIRPIRISTHAIETAWGRYSTVRDAFTFAYTTEGHKFICLTFPSAPATWVFDVITKLWHERDSLVQGSSTQSIARWRGNCSIGAYGFDLIGDFLGQGIGKIDWNQYLEFDTQIIGQAISPPYKEDRKRVFCSRFELEMETGLGTSVVVSPVINIDPPLPLSASAGNPVIDLTADPQVPNRSTQVAVFAPTGSTGIFVESMISMGIGDTVQVWLDDGSVFDTSIVAIFNPSEPQIYLDYSKDGGFTFSKPQLPRALGKLSETTTRLRWLRLGQSRQWYFRVTVSDPCKRVIISAHADLYSGM